MLMVLLMACKPKQKITKPAGVQSQVFEETGNCHLDYKSTKTLTGLIKKTQFDFKYLSAKFWADYALDGKSQGVNITLKALKDSVLWLSVTDPLLGAVEVARVLITRDSVRFMERINKRYFVGSFDTISKILRTDVDFEMLQSLLVGRSVAFYEEDERLRSSIDKEICQYILATIRKRRLRRALDKNLALKESAQIIWLDPDKYKIQRVFYTDVETNRTFDAGYSDFQVVDSLSFPHKAAFSIKAEKNLEIKLNYSKVINEKDLAFPFTIPTSYERIKRKQ